MRLPWATCRGGEKAKKERNKRPGGKPYAVPAGSIFKREKKWLP
jgi:hypothetical protein